MFKLNKNKKNQKNISKVLIIKIKKMQGLSLIKNNTINIKMIYKV
jgi:hypothetical protein